MTTDPNEQTAAVAAPDSPETQDPAPPPARPSAGLRRWLAWGTGVAVEIRGAELTIAVTRVRPSGPTLLGAARVPDFRNRPAAEWGADVLTLLRRHGAGHVAATVLLPRSEVIVRQVHLPGVADRDIEAAVRLQIDSLHPFADEDVFFSWARLRGTPFVLVGIARRDIVDEYSTLFAEAGLKTASFTFSGAALRSAVRLLSEPPAGFVLAQPAGDEVEIYGESEARPLYSATLPVSPERALDMARSELRLEPDAPAVGIMDVLPAPVSAPEGVDAAAIPLTWAASLYGACPWLGISGNLLPPERRRASSRARLVPTFALAGTLAVLLVLLAFQGRQADSRYLGVLQHEIARFEPLARKVDAVDRATATARQRSQALDDFRRRTRLDMDTLAEVTKLIPPPGWVANLDMDRAMVQIAGEVEQAAPLLKTFDSSPYFERTEFTMPISRSASGDAFRIRTGRQAPPVAAPAPESNAPQAPPAGGAK